MRPSTASELSTISDGVNRLCSSRLKASAHSLEKVLGLIEISTGMGEGESLERELEEDC